MKTSLRKSLKILIWIMGICTALLITVELLLSSSLATKLINRYASEYVEGELKFGKVSMSVFRNFPSVSLSLDDFSITYPSERFEEAEKKGVQGHLMYHGCGESTDTLASFSSFYASIRPFSLLFGKVDIPEVRLVRPRIFAHRYYDGSANWNIFIPQDKNGQDSIMTTAPDTVSIQSEATASMPAIRIGKIRLTEHPHIVYSDCRDTIFAMIDIKQVGLNGRYKAEKAARNRIGLRIDSLFVAGRVAGDTVALGLDRLSVRQKHKDIKFNANAKALLATRLFGRMTVPADLSASIRFPEDSVPAVSVDSLMADIAGIPIMGNAHLRFDEGRTEINGKMEISRCRVNDVIEDYISNFIPEAGKVSTDAIVSIMAECNGELAPDLGIIPAFKARVTLPESSISHSDINEKVNLGIKAEASGNRHGKIDIDVQSLKMATSGLDVRGKGGAYDIMSKDPLIKIDGSLRVSLDSLLVFVPDSLDIKARGTIHGKLNGNARLSNIDIYNFSNADLNGNLTADRIFVRMPKDTIYMSIQKMDASIGPETKVSRRDSSRSFRLIALSGNIGKADVNLKKSLMIKGENIALTAKNSAASGNDTTRIRRLSGTVSAQYLSVADAAGTSIKLDETENRFRISPKRGNPKVPVLSFSSSNKRINLQTEVNRAVLTEASIEAKAVMNAEENTRSLKPVSPRDSLVRPMRAMRQGKKMPEWMQEEDFRKQDLDLRLDQNMAKYFREWELDGNLNVKTGILMTPYFPQLNSMKGLGISFNNDTVSIDSIKVMSGNSAINAKGSVSGLKKALLGRGIVKVDLDLSSDRINADELLTAYTRGAAFNPSSITADVSEASDEEFMEIVIQETAEPAAEHPLLVIPANLNADISINASNITYSDLEIRMLRSDLIMKERCVQITNTLAASNMGNVGFEGFYATRSKKDLKAGFNFNCSDITAEKAIALMPAIDTIMPLLKSFSGNLNCDVAATASLDTNMNILLPTINGVMRISGDNLTISNSPLYTSIAKQLKFDNSKKGKIKHMNVESVIKDNVMEVFPFVLSLDRYTIALSGKQNFDMSFRYHASIIKSPMLIKVGVDLYGKDYDHMKFSIGKPKYKTTDVPVFSTVIDDTRINLADAIHRIFEKGVDAAIMENQKFKAINELKQKIGYVNAVDQELQELSEEEKKLLEESTAEDTVDTATTEITIIENE